MSSASRVRRVLATTMALLVALSTMALSGCAGVTGSKEIELNPVVTSPAISMDGVLKVGVDSTNPPYAGVAHGTVVGIDVDVAAAIAEQMGLSLEIVDIAGLDVNDLLATGQIDVIMDVEQTGGNVIQGTQVGPYIESGPALFTKVMSDEIPVVDLASIAGSKVAVQKDSLSAWSVEELIGAGTADPRETLPEAFDAVGSGEVPYAAADAIVGSYLAVEYEDISCVKILGTPIGVYMGVTTENTQLADALTDALRAVRDNGSMRVILSKWLGPVSAQVVMGSSAITSQGTTGTAAPELPEGEVDTGDDLPDPANAGGE